KRPEGRAPGAVPRCAPGWRLPMIPLPKGLGPAYTTTMKRQLVCLVVALLATVLTPRAEGPDDQYVRIYYLIQEADSWNEKGDLRQAIAKYMEAQSALKTLQVLNPDWNERVVNYRLDYIARKLDPLTQKLPPLTAAPGSPAADNATVASLMAATNQLK